MRLSRITGRCTFLFFLAVIFDVAGVILLLLGIFGRLSAWDFFVYTGAVIFALSLVLWVLWYTFNMEISYKELGLDL